MNIVMLTGPAGSGKDTAAVYISNKLGLKHVSGGDVLRLMLSSLNLEPTKRAVGDFGTFLRTNYGTDVVLKMVLQQASNSKGVVNSGIRSPSEAELVKSRGGYICYIDANESIRHQRQLMRQRTGDALTARELHELDAKEHSDQDAAGQNLLKVKGYADVVIDNNGTLEEFYQKLDRVCGDVAGKFGNIN